MTAVNQQSERSDAANVVPINNNQPDALVGGYDPETSLPIFQLNSVDGHEATVGVTAPDGTDGIPLIARVISTAHPEAAELLIKQLLLLEVRDGQPVMETANRAIALLDEIKPTSALESMLASQMIAVHLAAMDCIRRGTHPGQKPEAANLDLRHAERLTSIFTRQLETLDKHRRKGEQQVVVKHVTVTEGAQAIVGDVHVKQGGEGGDLPEFEDQPHEA